MKFQSMVGSGLLVAGFLACLWPTEETRPTFPGGPSFDPQGGQEIALAPSGDTWIRPTSPNTNFGTDTVLKTAHVFTKQMLLQWDQDSIEAAVGSGTLEAAHVELTIQNATVGTFTSQFGIHRMTQHWMEPGATFNCAIDANPPI